MTRVAACLLLLLMLLGIAAAAGPCPPGPTLTAPFRARGAAPIVVPGEQLRVGILKPGGGHTIVTLPLEVYVSRVLAGEAARESPPAALEALAITVRTFALANRGRHHADGFDLCDQTHCQVLRPATAGTERAANATAGRVLVVHDTAVASVFYSASCGGRTEIPSAVWPGAENPSYLPSHRDAACRGAPLWSAELRSSDLMRALRAAGFAGTTLRDVQIASRNTSGRVARLHVVGLRPDRISGQELRVAVGRTLGWQYIKSTVFEIQKNGDLYRFTGRGSGHGVGLCVIGSARLAVEGKTVADILGRYFPGLTISQSTPVAGPIATPNPEMVVALPEGDEGDRAAVLKEALRSRDELARTLGVPRPPRIVLRFHATTDEYERATGRAWFTSAALVDGELHLLPLVILRERGVLERVLRHELVHALTDSVLAQRPMWVREGAATYFSGEQPRGGAQRPAFKPATQASCPDDRALQLPVSVGALSNAQARARACFARQIQAGRSWRDVQ
jgi:stage II sporulation protein D